MNAPGDTDAAVLRNDVIVMQIMSSCQIMLAMIRVKPRIGDLSHVVVDVFCYSTSGLATAAESIS